MKKALSLLLAVLIFTSVIPAALADNDGCVVIGANLNDTQIADVYSMFGISRGSVSELTVTNAEERAYLVGLVDDSVIGHNSISCVYVKVLSPGSGLSVVTNNITWCTGDMYINALATAGITDAEIRVAAPFGVSGTAALTGIYKAYEHITGETLNESAKQVSTEELTITGNLSDLIGSEEATAIINELKSILGETKNMTDSELRSTVTSIAATYGVVLDESEMQMVIQLVRKLEKLDISGIISKVDDIQNAINKAVEAKNKVDGFVGKVVNFFAAIGEFFTKVGDFFGKLFN